MLAVCDDAPQAILSCEVQGRVLGIETEICLLDNEPDNCNQGFSCQALEELIDFTKPGCGACLNEQVTATTATTKVEAVTETTRMVVRTKVCGDPDDPNDGENQGGGNDGNDVDVCAADEHVVDNRCAPCRAGTTNAAGDDASQGDTSCDKTFCAAQERVLNNACVPCPEGTANGAGDDASQGNTTCEPTMRR